MAGRVSRAYVRPLQSLLVTGAFGQLTDAELLNRSIERADADAAFETLVLRHGPAVMQACRRILGDSHDAEDAFQATFLVLARRAGSISHPDALAGWLLGVARRIARKSRVAKARRRRHEQRLAERTCRDEPPGLDFWELLREEINRLPDALRDVVALCYLEEMSYALAARRLGVTEGTVRGRLVKARRMLRARLARTGEVATVGSARARSIALGRSRGAVPCSLVAATTRAAIKVAAGRGPSHGVSTEVIRLMEGVLSMTILSRVKLAATMLAACGIGIAGAAALASKPAGCEVQATPCSSAQPAAQKERVAVDATGAQSLVPGDTVNRRRMTLEEAVNRFLDRNVSQWRPIEIPMARADLLMHFDTTELTSLTEAVFQDRVRNEIDEVYKSFVGLEVAQEKLRRASDALARWDRICEATLSRIASGKKPSDDIQKIVTARLAARARRDKAAGSRREARLSLGMLLNLPTDECETLQVTSRLSRLRGAVLPPLDELVRSALERRPDLVALRFGQKRAETDLALAQTSRLTDVYVLYQPYTFGGALGGRVQDNSLARALAVPLPLYNRNQGNIERTRINVDQARAQLASLERRISDDVERIYLDCDLSLGHLSRMDRGILADAARRCDAAEEAYFAEVAPAESRGKDSLNELLRAADECQNEERRYVAILARYLGSTLDLNTCVSKRIMP
jgi:RNA polymerase sigma factor (sigma-70 family)